MEEKTRGKPCKKLANNNLHKANGRFVTINLYQSTFDPQNLLQFKYLVTIRIQKGTLGTYVLLDDILLHMDKVANRDVLTRNRHHMITMLVSTTWREFAHDAYVELEDNKLIYVELEIYEHTCNVSSIFLLITTQIHVLTALCHV